MNFAHIDQRLSKAVPVLLLMAVSSLGTSWALKTPELSQKADKLSIVETQTIPKLKSIAGCQTMRADVATKTAAKSEAGADVDLKAIPNCASLKKGKTDGVPMPGPKS